MHRNNIVDSIIFIEYSYVGYFYCVIENFSIIYVKQRMCNNFIKYLSLCNYPIVRK